MSRRVGLPSDPRAKRAEIIREIPNFTSTAALPCPSRRSNPITFLYPHPSDQAKMSAVTLSPAAFAGMRLLADESKVENSAFPKLVIAACQAMASNAPTEVDVSAVLGATGEERRLVYKSAFSALCTFVLECCRGSASSDLLQTFLVDDLLLSTKRSKYIIDEISKQRPLIRAKLAQSRIGLDKVVGFSWRLDYSLTSSNVGKTHRPAYVVSVKVERRAGNAAGKVEEVVFTCSAEQLRDFSAKVKDAIRSVDRVLKTL